MENETKINNDEINLVDLIQIIWKGKWIIVAVTVIAVALAFGYLAKQPNNFKATTDIEPINISEESRYLSLYSISKTFSSNQFIDYNKDSDDNRFISENSETFSLQDLSLSRKSFLVFYIQILKERSLFEDAIRKYNLLDVSKYINKKEYNEAITKLASNIEIITTTIPSEDENSPAISFTNIIFIYNDTEKWKDVLKYVHENANKVVKKKLRNYFENFLILKKQGEKERLEDLEITISNLIFDYDRETSDNISYLLEQSEIAKKLGISKNTIEVQTFGNQTLFSSVNTDAASPFYLRGYEAIDKEISLITSRLDKKAFIKGLYPAEREVRSIKQNKFLERIASNIESSSLAENQDFSAGTIKFLTTEFEYKNKESTLFMTALFGSIIGVILVLILSVFKSQKIPRKH